MNKYYVFAQRDSSTRIVFELRLWGDRPYPSTALGFYTFLAVQLLQFLTVCRLDVKPVL